MQIINVALAAGVTAGVTVHDLRVEHLRNPLGIDNPRPRFRWALQGEEARGLVQQAFRLRISKGLESCGDVVEGAGASDDALDEQRAAVESRSSSRCHWDSDWVASASGVDVAYEGPALQPGSLYSWSVSVSARYEGGARKLTSASSQEGAYFSTGLPSLADWNGHWIGMAEVDGTTGPAPWFRKTFSVAREAMRGAAAASALLYIASVGYVEVTVNGQRVTEAVLTPSISFLPRRVLYNVYDVTALLRAGTNNSIGIWASAAWATYGDMQGVSPPMDLASTAPLVLAELRLGGALVVATDGSWRCRGSTVSHLGGPWGQGGFGGDALDERRAIAQWDPIRREVHGWDSVHLDDADWAAATTYEGTFLRNVSLSADLVEPTVKASSVPCAAVVRLNATSVRLTMAQLYTGWFEVTNLRGAPNSTVRFSVSTTAGRAEEYAMADSYTFGARGAGAFSMRFSYHEIELITVSGLAPNSTLRAEDVVGHRLHTNLTRTGSFGCSSALLTQMYETTVNNYLGLTTGGMSVDCPHRERRGYGGDGHTSLEFALQNFGVGALFNKWTRDFADVQGLGGLPKYGSAGLVPNTAPTVGGGGGPAWSLFVITNPWQTYLATGDTAILSHMWPTMVAQLSFWAQHTHPTDGLLHPWTASQWEFLGDWITPHGSETNVSSPASILFNSCVVRYAAALAAKVAAVLGKPAEAQAYAATAAALARAINAAFRDPATGWYADGLQTHQVMPLAAGVVDSDSALEAQSMANLEHAIRVDTGTSTPAGHLDTGLTGTYFMTKLLTEAGRNDLVFSWANQTTYPSYGYFLAQGYTTWPEQWSARGGVSKMHGCYNSIGLWFVQGIAGIAVNASDAAFPLQIRAGVDAGDVTWASGARAAPSGGAARSSWALDAAGFRHNVTVPGGTKARVLIPASQVDDVTEDGMPVSRAPGVTAAGMRTINAIRYAVLEVGSGVYEFASSWSRPPAA